MVSQKWKEIVAKKVDCTIKEKGSFFVAQRLDCVDEVKARAKKVVESFSKGPLMCPNSTSAQLIYVLDMERELDNETKNKAMEIAVKKGAMFVMKALQVEDKM